MVCILRNVLKDLVYSNDLVSHFLFVPAPKCKAWQMHFLSVCSSIPAPSVLLGKVQGNYHFSPVRTCQGKSSESTKTMANYRLFFQRSSVAQLTSLSCSNVFSIWQLSDYQKALRITAECDFGVCCRHSLVLYCLHAYSEYWWPKT